MNREDLKNYKYTQMWIKDQTEYIEAQKETINRLNSIISDMPRGNKIANDTEAEKLSELIDNFNELINTIIEEKRKQERIVEKVHKIEFPYKNILIKVYIQGKSLVTAASEMNYSYRDLCRKHGIALNIFDEI